MKDTVRRILAFFLCLTVFISIGAGSCFALPEEFVTTSGFLVKVCVFIEFYYPDGSYGGYATSRGTGLLVGNDGEMKGVVTNYCVIGGEHLTAFADGIVEQHGFEGYNIGVPQILPEGSNNMWGISGNVIVADDKNDLAVLELSSPIYIDGELKIRSGDSYTEGEQVFSICYAEISDNVYELSVGEGFASESDKVYVDGEDYSFISHDVSISDTAQGGFIVDCDGSVLGLLTDKATASPYEGICAFSVFEIIDEYLFDLGWGDCVVTECPSDAVIISQEVQSEYFGENGFADFIMGLLDELGFEPDDDNLVLTLGIVTVLLLLALITAAIFGAIGFIFVLMVFTAAVIVICVVVKKKRRASADVSVNDKDDGTEQENHK